MFTDGADFNDVLRDAQRRGYAEANPAADVEGLDAARKIVILAALAFGKAVSPKDICTEGITSITREDVELASEMGYAIKLIGHTKKIDGKILCMVSPRLVSLSSPLANINDVFNGILLEGDMVGSVMFYGPGAGKLPTASAVCADIVDAAAHVEGGIKLPRFTSADSNELADINAYVCKRFFVFDKDPENSACLKCLSAAETVISRGDRVAVLTCEMVEKDANEIASALPGCRAYRLL
jgi:homoserine dehydrogenase